jgi:hypothetical protein
MGQKIMMKKWFIQAIFILCLCSPTFLIYAQDDPAYSKQLESAKKFVDDDKGKKALNILKPLVDEYGTYDILILAGQAYAEADNPMASLHYYNLALKKAKDADERDVAYFGIAKMQFWMGNYVRAERVYRVLLRDKLNKEDHELALAGLVKSLAYQDRTRLAYSLIPPDLIYTTPEMVVAASQASLWSDWADITKDILIRYQPITKKLDPWSPLGEDLRDAAWQTDLATSPNVITPTAFMSEDSEGFIVRRSTLDYTHYWSQIFQTSIGVDNFRYTQNNTPPSSGALSANGIYVGETWRPTRTLIFSGNIEPTNYGAWHPVLWNAKGTYQPNDMVGIGLLAFREIVETFPSFYNEISDNQYVASLTLNPLPYITLDGSLSALRFSDTNVRTGYYASFSALVLADVGLYTIFQASGYKDKFQSPNYFSPLRYDAQTALLRLSRKLGATWHYYIDGGVGEQTITAPGFSPARSPINQWGLGITGPITSWMIFNAYYAQTTQASAFANSSTYRYQYGAVSINFLF